MSRNWRYNETPAASIVYMIRFICIFSWKIKLKNTHTSQFKKMNAKHSDLQRKYMRVVCAGRS